jgi:hypothetical protein
VPAPVAATPALPATATTLPRPTEAAPSAPRVRAAEPRPVAPAAAIDASVGPRARCGDRVFLSMILCMKRECEAPSLRNHPECVALREQEEAGRRRDTQ